MSRIRFPVGTVWSNGGFKYTYLGNQLFYAETTHSCSGKNIHIIPLSAMDSLNFGLRTPWKNRGYTISKILSKKELKQLKLEIL